MCVCGVRYVCVHGRYVCMICSLVPVDVNIMGIQLVP